MSENSYDLERFVSAQDSGGTYASALAELRDGAKRSHWMWFVFPQVAGLGRSQTAQRYAVSGLDEARAYLRHPVLAKRLHECVDALDALDTTDANRVLGPVDAVKLRSSMTLFERAVERPEQAEPFAHILEHYFEGRRDDATTGILDS